MNRPDKQISKLRYGTSLSIKEEFDLYLYICELEKANIENNTEAKGDASGT